MPDSTGSRSASVEDDGPQLSVVPASGTRQLILATAQRLFEERGYDGTSLRQIADAVGMTKAAVYYHYPAKEHLLLELTRPMLDAMSDMVARLRNEGGGNEGGGNERGGNDPHAALGSYLDLFVEHLPVVHMLSRDPGTQNHPDVGQRLRTLVEAVQRLIAGPDADDERTVRTACAMGAIHAVATMSPDQACGSRQVVLSAAMSALNS